MMVVIIIGVLVTLAVPNYMRSTERAKSSQAIATLKNMRSAALNYYTENQSWNGTTIADLATEAGANFDDTNDWQYAFAGNDTGFTLTATRTSGHWSGKTITLDQNAVWSDSSTGYPWKDAGAF